jgi:CRP-like cAMP-binding protein
MAIEDDIALLEQVPILALLGRDALRVLAIGAESQTLENGEVLFREGDAADSGFVVEVGALQALGRDSMQPVVIPRGTLVGEMSLLVETRRSTTVIASEPASVMRIARPLFLKMLQGYPHVAARLRKEFVMRTQRMMSDLGSVRHALDVSEITAAETAAESPKGK